LSKHLCKMSPLGGLYSLIPVTHLGTLLFFVVTHEGWPGVGGVAAGCCGGRRRGLLVGPLGALRLLEGVFFRGLLLIRGGAAVSLRCWWPEGEWRC
jgi:hypothetical protein